MSKKQLELPLADDNQPRLPTQDLADRHAQALITLKESQHKTAELEKQIKLREVENEQARLESERQKMELEKQKMESEKQKMELEKLKLELEKARLDNDQLRENQDQILNQVQAEDSLWNKRLLAYEKRFEDFERRLAEERQGTERKLAEWVKAKDYEVAERDKQWAQKVAELRAELQKSKKGNVEVTNSKNPFEPFTASTPKTVQFKQPVLSLEPKTETHLKPSASLVVDESKGRGKNLGNPRGLPLTQWSTQPLTGYPVLSGVPHFSPYSAPSYPVCSMANPL